MLLVWIFFFFSPLLSLLAPTLLHALVLVDANKVAIRDVHRRPSSVERRPLLVPCHSSAVKARHGGRAGHGLGSLDSRPLSSSDARARVGRRGPGGRHGDGALRPPVVVVLVVGDLDLQVAQHVHAVVRQDRAVPVEHGLQSLHLLLQVIVLLHLRLTLPLQVLLSLGPREVPLLQPHDLGIDLHALGPVGVLESVMRVLKHLIRRVYIRDNDQLALSLQTALQKVRELGVAVLRVLPGGALGESVDAVREGEQRTVDVGALLEPLSTVVRLSGSLWVRGGGEGGRSDFRITLDEV